MFVFTQSSFKKNLSFFIGTILNNSVLFNLKINFQVYKNLICTDQTDICIEGFQRSGNSFIYRLFAFINPATTVAHHTHGSQNIIIAVNKGIPTIVLIRNPLDAVSSLLVWDSKLSITIALFSYRLFYERILKLVESTNVVRFEDIVNCPSVVIDSIQKLQPNKFSNYSLSDKGLEKFKFDLVNSWEKDEKKSPLPNEYKDNLKYEIKEEICKHKDYLKTQKLYNQFLSQANFLL